jgi:hypothetical protein
VAIGTVIEPVPVLAPNFSPILRMAPARLGQRDVGRVEKAVFLESVDVADVRSPVLLESISHLLVVHEGAANYS